MKIAIITIYYPSDNVKTNIKQLISQFDKVFVCDNTPQISNKAYYDDMGNNLYYIWFNHNKGLSEAFNYVLKNNYNNFNDDDFVFFFDQDSYIQNNHVDLMIKEYTAFEEKGYDIGCFGPVYFNTSSNSIEIPKSKKKISENSYSVKSIITSSMCCKYSNLKCIDFWNESVFLDMADWDLSWRFIKKNKLCVISNVVVMNHSLGIGEKKILGFIKLRQGVPIREYYQTRDCLYLLREKYVPLKFRIRFILMLTVRPIIHLIFLDSKLNRLKYICMGFVDYLKKVKGVFPNN